jgi:hypothetical protein
MGAVLNVEVADLRRNQDCVPRGKVVQHRLRCEQQVHDRLAQAIDVWFPRYQRWGSDRARHALRGRLPRVDDSHGVLGSTACRWEFRPYRSVHDVLRAQTFISVTIGISRSNRVASHPVNRYTQWHLSWCNYGLRCIQCWRTVRSPDWLQLLQGQRYSCVSPTLHTVVCMFNCWIGNNGSCLAHSSGAPQPFAVICSIDRDPGALRNGS